MIAFGRERGIFPTQKSGICPTDFGCRNMFYTQSRGGISS